MILLDMQPILQQKSDRKGLVLQWSQEEDNTVKKWLCLDTECRVGTLFRCCWIMF